MPPVNVRTASHLTGKDRSTITRSIEKGRLSATRDARGRYLLDPAELERVFGQLTSPDARTGADAVQSAAVHDAHALAREIEMVREMLDTERAGHERERRGWEDERSFLRALVERQTEQLKLLTDRRAEPEPITSPPRRRWWRWALFILV